MGGPVNGSWEQAPVSHSCSSITWWSKLHQLTYIKWYFHNHLKFEFTTQINFIHTFNASESPLQVLHEYHKWFTKLLLHWSSFSIPFIFPTYNQRKKIFSQKHSAHLCQCFSQFFWLVPHIQGMEYFRVPSLCIHKNEKSYCYINSNLNLSGWKMKHLW